MKEVAWKKKGNRMWAVELIYCKGDDQGLCRNEGVQGVFPKLVEQGTRAEPKSRSLRTGHVGDEIR